MYRTVSFGALAGGHGGGHGGGGGHHGGGGGGGGHHGGGHHGGGGGGHHHYGGRGGTVVVQGGGWGPGWYSGDASYPYPVVVEDVCEVMDANGRCAIFDAEGHIIGFRGLGEADQEAGVSATTWVSGGILAAAAVLMFVIDTKDPLKLKAAR